MSSSKGSRPTATAESAASQEILAAVVREPGGPFRLEKLEVARPGASEVLVRIVATGVCQTDAHSRDQSYPVPLPVVLGHEGAGIVEQVGDAVTSVSPGDHVVLSFPSCGQCVSCLGGDPANCERGFELSFGAARADGGSPFTDDEVHGYFFGQSSFATYALTSERGVVRVPEDVPLEILGPLGCGIQTGAGAVLNSLEVEPSSSVAVFGVGGVGLAAIMAARVAGARSIIAVDVNDERLALARELGATHSLNSRATDDLAAAVREIEPRGVDYVLETTALPQLLALAVDVLAPMGTAGLIGGAPAGTTAPIDMNQLLNGGRRLRGIAQGDSVPQVFIPQLIELYRAGRFPFDRLVSFYDFADINEAFADTRSGKAIKPVLRIGAA
ncbi:NAD(P)-dependent alcohol dehydrogenase [Streptomyces sp. NPDC088725]|uniref:NAD(P)-dependent alcohol dehydrogenase n=1 Tax=Streptomyces sp. NPDC088725 TaxID=3365873 RepID=UPI0038202F4F